MEESYVSLTELKVILDKEKAARGELNPEQQYSLSHASLFARVPPEKVPVIVKELMEIPMMSPFNAVKIADLMPTHLDDVRAIFAKERFSLSKEEDRKSTRLNSSHVSISYAVFCLKKKNTGVFKTASSDSHVTLLDDTAAWFSA